MREPSQIEVAGVIITITIVMIGCVAIYSTANIGVNIGLLIVFASLSIIQLLSLTTVTTKLEKHTDIIKDVLVKNTNKTEHANGVQDLAENETQPDPRI